MSPHALRTIWSFLGILAFAFALTSALRTTGSDVADYLLPLGSSEPFSAALVSWPLLATLIAALLYVTGLYARHRDVKDRLPWVSRIPIFYFDMPDVEPSSELGARYQRAVAVAFLGLPLLLQAAVFLKFLQGTAFAPDQSEFASSWQHFWPSSAVDWSSALAGAYRFGSPDQGVTYYPFVSPYSYSAGELALLVFSLSVWRVVRGGGQAVGRRGSRR